MSSNYGDYSQKPQGYGRLTETQAADIKNNKSKIEGEKTFVKNYISNLKLGTTDEKASGLLNNVVKKQEEAQTSPDLTAAQKKLLSNVQKEIDALKADHSNIKDELKTLAKERNKTEAGIHKDLSKLNSSLEKVDSLLLTPKSGSSNFIFGTSKRARVDSSEKHTVEAAKIKENALNQVRTLNEKAQNTEGKIKAFSGNIQALNTNLQNRLSTLKDVHTSIAQAKEERGKLIEKYELRNKEFSKFKEPSKMDSLSKGEIKGEMKSLDAHIKKLENLEKKLGDMPIQKGKEDELLKDAKKEMKMIQSEIGTTSSEVQSLIRHSEHNKMGSGEKTAFLVSKFFGNEGKSNNTFNKQETAELQKMYPGVPLEEAAKLFSETHLSRADTFKEQNMRDPKDIPVPTDLPPVFHDELRPPPTDLPPVFHDELRPPPEDLPPPLPAERENVARRERPIKAKHLNPRRDDYKALNPKMGRGG